MTSPDAASVETETVVFARPADMEQPLDSSAPDVDETCYRRAQRYVDHLVDAVQSIQAGDRAAAGDHAAAADRQVWPLGEVHDANELRDWIAGVASAAEHYMRQIGVPIQADGRSD